MKNGTNSRCRLAAIFPLFLLFAAAKLAAQPVSDANGVSNVGSTDPTISISNFTVPANDDRLLVVCTANSANAPAPTVNYGSTPMTMAVNRSNTNGLRATMFYLVLGSGASVTETITATGTSLQRIGASSFHNVLQSDPTDGEVHFQIPATATSSTLAVSSTPNDLVCDCVSYFANGFTGFSVGSGQIQTFQTPLPQDLNIALAQSFEAGASPSVAMEWTLNGTTTGGGGVQLGMNIKPACPPTGTVWYVDAAAASGGTGASWACAFQNLQDAIDAASSGQEIWVKAGTYLPTEDPFGSASPTDPRDKTFYLKDGVAIYGGFDGSETARTERDWVANPTILSGDLGTSGDATDNAYHVVLSVSDANTTVLDGFTVTKGNADGTGSITVESQIINRNLGGGLYTRNSSVAPTACTFSQNTASNGGGMYNSGSTLTVTGCTFSQNTATSNGGGVVNSTSTPTFNSCSFLSNTATGGAGGALRNQSAVVIVMNDCIIAGNTAGTNGAGFEIATSSTSATLTNCLITGNSGGSGGGGIYNNSTAMTITNCTVSGNKADDSGGGISFWVTNPTVTNCVVWNNREGSNTGTATANLYTTSSTPVISYSLIQNRNPSGTGNLNGIPNAADSNYPQFTTQLDPATAPSTAGDFHLTDCSPVLNLGDNSGAPATDLFGNARPFGTNVDLGVHEFQGAAACSAAGTIWYVDAAGTTCNTGTSWACAFQNLQDAIDAASSGHEIWVKTGTYFPTKDPFGNASPTDPRDKVFYLENGVAIYGGFDGSETARTERDWAANPTILSGDLGTSGDATDNAYHVVLSVSDASTTVLDGFTVEKGKGDGSGSITVESNSVSRNNGGGMYNRASSPTLTNCMFSNNSASTSGGGMYNVSTSSPTLTDCTFSGNSASSGGGMYNNSTSNPTLTNCTFSGNTVTSGGGGMYNNSTSNPTLTNCTFSGNSATSSGGGMFNNSTSNPTLTNCTFSGNSATSGSSIGGGMINLSSSPILSHCKFLGCSSVNGGGMYNTASANPTLTNCLFSGNNAVANGGGIFNGSSSPTLTNCTFSGNKANSSGGAIRNDVSSNPILKNCLIWNNRVGSTTGSASSAISNNSSTPVITYSLIQNQTPSGTGNLDGITFAANSNYPAFTTPLDPATAPSTDGDFHIGNNCSPVIETGTNTGAPVTDFFGNARPFGTNVDLGVHEFQSAAACPIPGTVWFVDAASTGCQLGTSWDCAFQNLQDAINTASSGHEIWVKAGTYLPTAYPTGCTGCSTDRDKAFHLKDGVKIYGGFDGSESARTERDWVANPTILSGDLGTSGDNSDNARHVVLSVSDASTTVLDGFTVEKGNASGSSYITVESQFIVRDIGGGLYSSSSSASVNNCTFSSHSASSGSGVYISSGSPVFSTCLFSGNSSSNSGAGMYITSASPTLTDCTFSSNTATNNGGGMYNISSSSPTLTDCTFSSNTATNSGGGMYSTSSSPTLTDCTFSGNTAGSGGGTINVGDSPVFSNCLFLNNIATGNNGGGMYNSSSSSILTDCTFSDNTAAYNGGGMFNSSSSSPTLTNCTFSGNTASNSGGGIRNESSTTITLNGCIFTANSATADNGGGLYLGTGSTSGTLTNCLFSGNFAGGTGGAIQNNATAISLTNCTVSGNRAGSSTGGGGIVFSTTSSSEPILKNCLVWNNRSSTTTGSATANLYTSSSTPVITYSLIQNQTPSGTGNLDGVTNAATSNYPAFPTPLDPATAPSTAGDFSLTVCSPVLDRGTDSGAPTTDILGNARVDAIFGGDIYDMGAYEYQGDADADNDGYQACTGFDCNDANASINPGATETVDDGIDQNCDGGDLCYVDADNDGYRPDAVSTVNSTDLDCADSGEAVSSDPTTDCDDNCAACFPGNPEICDNKDNDCDLSIPAGEVPGSVWYVDASASAGGNGASWGCAFQNLQDAINAASSGHEIWVKAGTYLPTAYPTGCSGCATDRDKAFHLKNVVKIFGGFDGSETMRSERDWAANPTILSGDLNGDDVGFTNNGENAYHVVLSVNDINTTELDGFTISGGNANGTGTIAVESGSTVARSSGGGLSYTTTSSGIRIRNCAFTWNDAASLGGGLLLFGNSTPEVSNCTISNNRAHAGGGIYNIAFCSPTVTNCVFSGNQASTPGGAAVNETFSDAAYVNCVFSGNTSATEGGAMYNSLSSPTLTNCTFSGNRVTGSIGGAISNASSSNPVLKNCVIWNNRVGSTTGSAASAISNSSSTPVITYSLIQAQTPSGTGNLDGITNAATSNYPAFTTPLDPATAPSTAGNFSLTVCSPVLDRGTDSGAPTGDILGNARVDAIFGGDIYDMGAYEYQSDADADNDGHQACTGFDCNDNDAAIYPGATEIVDDGIDQNCDGGDLCYVDADNDGYRPDAVSTVASTDLDCDDAGEALATDPATDCDDNDMSINPAATDDVCNAIDEDCSGTAALDVTAPSITCPGDQTVAADGGCAGVVGSHAASSATDNCGTPTVVQSPVSNTILSGHDDFETVVLTATDGAGNTETCSFTVTLKDVSAPGITCHAFVTVSADGSCSGTVGNQSPAALSDNCGTPGVTQSPASNTPLSGHDDFETVVLTATDGAGNTATCTITVTLKDQAVPTITCPSDQTVSADINGDYVLADFRGSATSSDNCGSPAEVQSPVATTTLGIGGHTVSITATDGAGLTATCSFALTVQAGCAAPTVACPSGQTVAANGSCQATMPDYTGLATPSGGCGTVTLGQSPSINSVLNLGPQTVVITATDQNSNTGTCSFTVTVADQTVPSITCPADATVAADGSCAGVVGVHAATSAMDNCGAPTVVQSPASGTILSGHNDFETVVLTATDGAGNTETCSFTVTLKDDTAPSITCPADATVSADGSCAGTVGVRAAASSSDNCGAPTVVQSPASGTILSGHNDFETVVLTATDGAGNTETCSFTVTLKDDTAPSITCPADATVSADGSCAGTVGVRAAASSSDNCGTPGVVQSPASNTILSGHDDFETVVLTATDGAGNTETCSFTVTLKDVTAPSITCPADATVSADGSCAGVVGSHAASSATDNCGTPTVVQSPASNTILSGHDDFETVVLTATDGAGNTETCSFTVTLKDDTAPSITCPADATVSADGSCAGTVGVHAAASATDNCGTPGVAQSPGSGTALSGHDDFETVVLTATDGAGNTETCSFTVTLKDVTAPTITCPADATVSADGSCAGTVGVHAAASATDNCGTPTVVQSPASNTILSGHDDFETVVLTATDGAGNTETCSFTVTLKDDTAPSITCPADATVSADGSCAGTVGVHAAASATDNCGTPGVAQSPGSGTALSGHDDFETVVLTATDGAGNTETCSFTVTLKDVTAPSITCPADATVSADGSCAGTVGVHAAASATDNCGTPTVVQSPASNTILSGHDDFETVVLTATDGAGNTETCSFTVTLKDDTAPSITCPADATVSADGSCAGTIGGHSAASATDNCGTPTVVQSPVSNTVLSGHNDFETVVLTATDGAGNTETCSFTVTLKDATAPSITCPSDQTVSADLNGDYVLADFTGMATSSDNCGSPAEVQSPVAATTLDIGGHTVSITATDGAGLTAICSFALTVEAACLPPTLDCPANTTVSAGGSCQSVLADYRGSATLSDGCGTVTLGQSPADGTMLGLGNQTVTLTATDQNGSTASCSFTVTVSDQSAPTITCPDPVTVGTSGGVCGGTATWAVPVPTDNCGGAVIQSASHLPGAAFGGGTTTVAYVAVDAAGNTASCAFGVTVVDDDPPVAVCKAASVTLNASGTAVLAASAVNDGSSDNCTAPGSLSLSVSPNVFDCADSGPSTVTLTVTDGTGHSGQCTAAVTVVDALHFTQAAAPVATDGLAGDRLGHGVGLWGGVLVAGAPDDKVGTQAKQGSAYVFLQDQGGSGNWGQLKQVKASDGAAVDYFGNAVSVDGSLALVGAHGDNVGAITDAGSAYIYEKDHLGTDNWGQRAKFGAVSGGTSEPAAYDYYGNAVSLKNGRALVGAAKKQVGANAAQGAAYVHEQDAGGANTWGNVKKLTASDGGANNFFGQSVAQWGDVVLVGASGNLSNRGAAYLFGQDTGGAGNWGQAQKLTASDAAVGDGFGTGVSLTSGWAVIGAPNKSTYAGAAYIFKNNAGTWSEAKKLVASDGAPGDRFGTSVWLAGEHAYVSAVQSGGAGAVYVYHRDAGGAGNWGEVGKYQPVGGGAGERFGHALTASGDRLALGAPLSDVSGRVDQGRAYVLDGDDCGGLPRLQAGGQQAVAAQTAPARGPGLWAYPNPFADELTVELGTGPAAEVRVTDAAGRVVLRAALPAGQARLELGTAALRPGMYFVQVATETETNTIPVALVR